MYDIASIGSMIIFYLRQDSFINKLNSGKVSLFIKSRHAHILILSISESFITVDYVYAVKLFKTESPETEVKFRFRQIFVFLIITL